MLQKIISIWFLFSSFAFADVALDNALRLSESGKYNEAVEILKGFNLDSNGEAQYVLGTIISNGGDGFEPNRKAASSWFLKSAKNGDAKGQYTVALMYQNGDYLPRDIKAAIQYYELSARQGLPQAQFNLGQRYFRGEGVDKDYAKANEYFLAAANQGVPEAEFMVGLINAPAPNKPVSAPTDKNLSIEYLSRAAKKGHRKASSFLSEVYGITP